MPRRPHRVRSLAPPCTLLTTLIMFASDTSHSEICSDETLVDRSKQGEWTCTFDLQTRAVHVALLRGSGGPLGHSHLLWWPEERSAQSARVWKRQGEELSPGTLSAIPTPGNFFCSGHSFLPDGRLLVTGGTEKFNDFGTRAINVFNPRSGTSGGAWEPLAPDSLEAERWYPTNTTLADGKVFIAAGRRYDVLLALGGNNGSTQLTQPAALAVQQHAPRLAITFTESSPTPPGRSLAAYADLSMSIEVQQCSGDPNRFFAMMHGGIDDITPHSDLWGLQWDFASDHYTWVDLTGEASGTPPTARFRHTATFDPYTEALYVFGGKTGTGPTNELFVLSNVNSAGDCTSPTLAWSPLSVAGGPSARYGHSAVYDIIRKRLIFFGGSTDALGTQMSNDVWILKNLDTTPQWVKLDRDPSSNGTPRGRIGAAVAFDSTFFHAVRNDRLVVYGGLEGATQSVFSDTVWFGDILESYSPPRVRWIAVNRCDPDPCGHSSWCLNQVDPPPARGDAAALVQHDPYNRFIVYGGDTNGALPGGVTSEVWEFDLGKFHCNQNTAGYLDVTELHSNESAYRRTGHGLALDTRYRTARSPEVYDPVTRLVDSPKTAGGAPTPNIARWLFSYPFMFLLPDGKLFYAGPDGSTRRFSFETGWSNSIPSEILGDTSVFTFVAGGIQVMKCGQKANGPSLDIQRRVEIIDPTGAGPW